MTVLLLAAPAPAQNPPWLQPPPAPPPSYPQIAVSPAQVAELSQEAALVPLDVRGPARFAAGHLEGAVLLSWPVAVSAADPAALRSHLGALGLGAEDPVLIYGEEGDTEAIATAFFLLETAGSRQVRILDGGLAEARAAGMAIVASSEARAPRPFLAEQDGGRGGAPTTADLPALWEGFGRLGTEILDVRDRGDLWLREYRPPPRFAAGHVPHALPFDFATLLPPNARWPDPAAARERLLRLGPRPETRIYPQTEILVYGDGQSSGALALAYLVLRMVDLRVRVVVEGWEGWVAAGRPIERMVDVEEVRAWLAVGNPDLAADRGSEAVLLVDLREEWECRSRHLPGALCLVDLAFEGGLDTLEAARAAHPSGLDRDRLPIVLYCYGRDCLRSRNAAANIARAGFKDLRWFHGGYPEWRERELPVYPPIGQAKAQAPNDPR